MKNIVVNFEEYIHGFENGLIFNGPVTSLSQYPQDKH